MSQARRAQTLSGEKWIWSVLCCLCPQRSGWEEASGAWKGMPQLMEERGGDPFRLRVTEVCSQIYQTRPWEFPIEILWLKGNYFSGFQALLIVVDMRLNWGYFHLPSLFVFTLNPEFGVSPHSTVCVKDLNASCQIPCFIWPPKYQVWRTEGRLRSAPSNEQPLRVPNAAMVYCPVGIKISCFSWVFKLLPYLSAKDSDSAYCCDCRHVWLPSVSVGRGVVMEEELCFPSAPNHLWIAWCHDVSVVGEV